MKEENKTIEKALSALSDIAKQDIDTGTLNVYIKNVFDELAKDEERKKRLKAIAEKQAEDELRGKELKKSVNEILLHSLEEASRCIKRGHYESCRDAIRSIDLILQAMPMVKVNGLTIS